MADDALEGPPEHVSVNLRGMGCSATVAINERSDALHAAGREVFKLGLGQSPFPVPDDVVRALQRHAHEKDYLPVAGLAALRHAVARYTSRVTGVSDYGPDDVLIGPGSKELMFLLQLSVEAELLLPAPSWVSYAPQARMAGRPVRWIETGPRHDFMLSAEGLAQVCESRSDKLGVLVLNYPSNPTGATFSGEQLRAIGEVARRHSLIVLSDEIYGELHHEGAHRSIAALYPEGTVVSGGLSKWCGAGGWRLGTFVFPTALAWLRGAMTAAASETFTSTSAPIQHAAVTAFEGNAHLDEYLERSRRVLRALGRCACRMLDAARVRCPDPAGGFYLWADFRAHTDALAARGIEDCEALCERLLDETGVAILPGTAFGCPKGELRARLAYVDFDGAGALAAAAGALDEPWLRTHCCRVLTAIDKLCAWLDR